jgi:hypothetical protein
MMGDIKRVFVEWYRLSTWQQRFILTAIPIVGVLAEIFGNK